PTRRSSDLIFNRIAAHSPPDVIDVIAFRAENVDHALLGGVAGKRGAELEIRVGNARNVGGWRRHTFSRQREIEGFDITGGKGTVQAEGLPTRENHRIVQRGIAVVAHRPAHDLLSGDGVIIGKRNPSAERRRFDHPAEMESGNEAGIDGEIGGAELLALTDVYAGLYVTGDKASGLQRTG